MRVGDKVYCITNRSAFNIKGKTYIILYMDEVYNTIHISIEPQFVQDYGYSAFQTYLKNENDHYNKYLFSDYFIEPQEYRKLKLEKLNENR